jgi:hypothetical protein
MNHRRCLRKFLLIESNNSNRCVEDITPETITYSKKWTLCALVDLGAYKNHQAVKIFVYLYQKLNFTCDDLFLRAFSQIGKLTPGDFENVLRQSSFNPMQDAMGLIYRLKSENSLKKKGVFQSMGFLVNAA